MSHLNKDFVPEKVQESIFNALLQRPENHQCADCLNKSPTWASIEFGVFLCLGCSGIHRQLGPHITRVKSSKLDKWKRDQVEIMASVGNKLANDYYEFKLPKGFRRLDSTASPEESVRFVRDKYIKKSFAPPGYPTPVEEFLSNKEKGLVVDLSFAKPSNPTSSIQKEAAPIVRKKSMTLEQPQKESAKKEVPNHQPSNHPNIQATTQNNGIDFLTDDTVITNGPPQKNNNNTNSNQVPNQTAEPNKPSSAFDFDFSAIQKPQFQNQAQQQPQSQSQPQPQFQSQNQTQQQIQNMPQQSQPENNSSMPDIKKLYQQANNMYNNQYTMNPMMMNNGFNSYGHMQGNTNGFYQNNMYPQNNQGWNQNAQMNMNMNNYGQFPNNAGMQQMYQNNFNQNSGQAFMNNNMYAQQQQQFNYPMQNNGFPQNMNYAQNSPTKFF